VQTQLNAKQATVSGVDDTEIGYLDGVTSAIQTQLNDRVSKSGGDTITVASGTTVPLTIQNDGTGNSFVVNDEPSDSARFIINNAGDVGIGIQTSPGYRLQVYNNTNSNIGLEGNGNVNYVAYRSSDDVSGPVNAFRKARGNTGARTTVVSGDTIGITQFQGYDGTTTLTGSSIQSNVDDTVSTGIVPGRIAFNTTNSSGVNATRMTIKSSGNVGIGTTAPGYPLDVNGTVNATAFTVGGVALASGGMTVIASGTLSTTTLDLTSIPSTYVNLFLSIRKPTVTTNGGTMNLTVNGVTAGNYVYQTVNSAGTAFTNASGAGNIPIGGGQINNIANESRSQYNLSFINYFTDNSAKEIVIAGYRGANNTFENTRGYLNNLANGLQVPISRITLTAGTAFTGGTYTLYGVK
jgi:hypothetical protein